MNTQPGRARAPEAATAAKSASGMVIQSVPNGAPVASID